MSNVDLARSLYAAFARRDLAAILAVLSPDVEWTEPENPFNPTAGMHRGHDGFLEWANIGNASEEILALDVKRFLADGDTVAAVGWIKCRARQTGRIYESDFVHIIVVAGGRVVRFQEFFDTYAAGEAFRR